MTRLRAHRFRLALVAGAGGAVILALLAAGCSGARRPRESPRVIERGVASWYGPKFDGHPTANGERYDMHAMTAAHPTLPFGTLVEVRNLDNGRTCQVRINDRGPFVRGRIVDLSYAAARALDMVGPGTAHVELAVVSPGAPFPVRPDEPTVVLASASEPTAAPEEAPAADPPAPADAAFTVQVGAFSEVDRAETLRDLLARHFPDAAVRSDGSWHRVQVGRFPDRAQAEAFRGKLLHLGWAALVVAAP